MFDVRFAILGIIGLFLYSCLPMPIETKGDLMTVYLENIVQEDGGYIAKLSASTPSVKRPLTDFKVDLEGGFNNKVSALTKQIQYPKIIVEKAFNNPDQFKIKFKDGSLEIESKESENIKSENMATASNVAAGKNSSGTIAKSAASKKLIYEFNLSMNSWENPWFEGGSKAIFSSNDSQLQVNISESNGAFYQIQLFQYGLTIENNATYLLDLDVISNKKCNLLSKFHIYPPDTKLQYPEFADFKIVPGRNNVSSQFQAIDGSNSARLTLYFGQIDKGTKLEINSLKLYRISN